MAIEISRQRQEQALTSSSVLLISFAAPLLSKKVTRSVCPFPAAACSIDLHEKTALQKYIYN